MNPKHSDEYGDYLYEQEKDKRIMASEDNVKQVSADIWETTDRQWFSTRNGAIDHQYNIERGAI